MHSAYPFIHTLQIPSGIYRIRYAHLCTSRRTGKGISRIWRRQAVATTCHGVTVVVALGSSLRGAGISRPPLTDTGYGPCAAFPFLREPPGLHIRCLCRRRSTTADAVRTHTPLCVKGHAPSRVWVSRATWSTSGSPTKLCSCAHAGDPLWSHSAVPREYGQKTRIHGRSTL